TERARHRRGAALHPEAGLHVRGLSAAADVRQEPLSLHAGAAGSGGLRPTPVPGHLSRPRARPGPAVERALHRRPRRVHRAVDPRGRRSVEEVTLMNHKVRFGLVGAGGIAQAYAQAFQHCGDGRIVAVTDIREDAARALAEGLGCLSYDSYQTMARRTKLDA